ncbi:MAG: hypothetical protein ACXU8S_17700 [Phenylobacterium sp.]
MADALKPRIKPFRGWPLFWLVICTMAYAGVAPLCAVGAIFSWLVFDHPGNLLNPFAWLAFLLMVLFWVVCILAPFAAWVFRSRGQARLTWAAIAAPLIWLALLVALLQFVPA